MRQIIAAARRAMARHKIRSLEIELQGQTDALAAVRDVDLHMRIAAARRITKRELAKARADYNAMLPPGTRRTWSAA